MTHCHCSMCRKTHGTAFATYVGGAAEGFRWSSGEELTRRYESSPGNRRAFCSRCGSVVPGEPTGGRVFMPAGNLDDDPGVRPVAHIFAASKASWHDIADDTPRHDAWPPGWPASQVARPSVPAVSREGAVRGSCLCGGVSFEVSGDFKGIVKCHCSRCRKGRSAAHCNNLFIESPEFEWLSGRDLVACFAVPDAQRFQNCFCRICGSIVPRREPDRARLAVPAGSLDTDSPVGEGLHIFVGSKAPWYDITDEHEQHDTFPPRRTR
jgi:hypothetical protein